MFKVAFAEFKKILSKPGIYILSILLAVILVLGVFVYKPTVYESTAYVLNGNTYLEKYTDFIGGQNYGKKAEADKNLSDAVSLVSAYTITDSKGSYTQKEYIEKLVDIYEEKYDIYYNYAFYTDPYPDEELKNAKKATEDSLLALSDAIDEAFLKSAKGSFTLLTSSSNYDTYKAIIKDALIWANMTVNKSATGEEQYTLADHFALYEANYKQQLENIINAFIYPTLSKEFISNYATVAENTKLNTMHTRLNNILADMLEGTQNNVEADEMDRLANLYTDTVDTYVNLVKNELICHAFDYVKTGKQLDVKYLSAYSDYDSNSLLMRYSYIFDHDSTVNDYARPLTIGLSSNTDTNAYDYAYFVLRLFSFVIIVYAVMTACHSIAGEIKEGSMRYFAIRPVSRGNIYFGKLFAITILSLILIIFSGVISLCVGGAVYGLDSGLILTIFNGSTAITMHPIAMIAIYLVSLLLELIVYTSIAMLFSSILKSDLFAVTIALVLYLINTLLPIFVQGANTWLAFYPFSHISLYALFGSSIYAISNNFYNLLLGAKVFAGTNIILTLCVILVITVVTNIVAVTVFKNKEL
ncbi:MAG: hypothetical protein E7351_02165 [Clostridiales bacterium]|nr:hypothetical protein [Clostridiales bacterium]